jgi:hypothetical protein
VRLLDAIKEFPTLVEAVDVTLIVIIEFILDSPPIIDLVETIHVVTLDEYSKCLRLCTMDSQITNGFTIIHNTIPRLFMAVISKILKKLSTTLYEFEPCGTISTCGLETSSSVETNNKFVL